MSLNLNAKQVPGLEFYRRELLMQLGYFQDWYRWMPGVTLVVLFLVVTIIVDRRLALPLTILFAVFAGVWYWQWKRELPQLRSELQKLQTLETD